MTTIDEMFAEADALLPPCPSWCVMLEGHPWESVDNERAETPTLSRFHSGRSLGQSNLTQEEFITGGVVRRAAVVISTGVASPSGCLDDLTVGEARSRAAELLTLADQLEAMQAKGFAERAAGATGA